MAQKPLNKSIILLKKRIIDLKKMHGDKVRFNDPGIKLFEKRIISDICEIFGEDSLECYEYKRTFKIWKDVKVSGLGAAINVISHKQECFRAGIADTINKLGDIIVKLEQQPKLPVATLANKTKRVVQIGLLPPKTAGTVVKNLPNVVQGYVFILMAMGEEDHALEDVNQAIKRTCKENGLKAERVDDIEHTEKITDKIMECIRNAQIVIADLTYEKPNVYYELGYAHGIEKKVILTAKKGTKLHFDIKDFNVIFYRNITELSKRLDRRISALVRIKKSN